MKKQIFLIAVLVLSASLNKIYAQCSPDEKRPSPGVEYTYTANISGVTTGTEAKYWWYIVDNVDVFATTPLTVGTLFTVNGTNYNVGDATVNYIKITWTPASIGNTYYLVLRYKETTSTTPTCEVENISVFEIKPLNTFLLAFEGGMLNAGTYTATAGSNACAAAPTGALVTPATPSVLITYGNNTLYYVATASGILGQWRPSIQLPALATSQTYVSAEWTADMTGGGGWVNLNPALNGQTQDLVSGTNATVTNATTGTPILIRIVINNNNWQTLAAQSIQVGLDGYLPTAYSASDITGGTGPTACDALTAFGRTATFTINARPTTNINNGQIPKTNP